MSLTRSHCFLNKSYYIMSPDPSRMGWVWLRKTRELLEPGEAEVQESQLSSYLDKFMWGERYGRHGTSCFVSILSDIATQYPV